MRLKVNMSLPETAHLHPLRHHATPPLRHCLIALTACLALAGCDARLGTGGTGEYVVPQSHLREIRPLDLDAVSRPRPPETAPTTRGDSAQATQPSTSPASQPAAPREVPLTLVEVRRLALENNLDLKIELL